jgi:hypothetical protein
MQRSDWVRQIISRRSGLPPGSGRRDYNVRETTEQSETR